MIVMAAHLDFFPHWQRKGCLKFILLIKVTSLLSKKLYKKSNLDLIWLETPSNPLLQVVDIEQIALQAKACNSLVAVDNTFLSPALQNPLMLGADIVVHSTTKYINGHSDIVGGAAITNNEEILQKLKYWANNIGLTGSPFDSYLILRGLRTLGIRMEKHERNATALVDILSK